MNRRSYVFCEVRSHITSTFTRRERVHRASMHQAMGGFVRMLGHTVITILTSQQ